MANQYDAATSAAGKIKKRPYLIHILKYTKCTQRVMPFTHISQNFKVREVKKKKQEFIAKKSLNYRNT